jgi:alpha-L-fucosidase
VGLRWDLLPAESSAITPVIYYSEEEAGREGLLDINGTPTSVSFSEGIPSPLPPVELTWGPVYTSGPHAGFLDQPNGDPAEANPGQPWGSGIWTPRNDWKNNTLYRLPAAMLENWYWLQQITAATPATALVGLPTNDGVAVYLNGEPVYVGNNPLQEVGKRTIVRLHLRQGENTLLVKSFNRFGKQVEVGVFADVPQLQYRNELPSFQVTAGEPLRIELRNAPDVPVHRDLGMPNVWISLD